MILAVKHVLDQLKMNALVVLIIVSFYFKIPVGQLVLYTQDIMQIQLGFILARPVLRIVFNVQVVLALIALFVLMENF